MKTRGMVLKTAVMVIVPLLLLVSILGAPFAKVYATGTVVGIESAEDVKADSFFDLSIYLAKATKVIGLGFELDWDPDVISINNIRLSDDIPPPNDLTVNIDPGLGWAKVGLVNKDAPDYLTWEDERPVLILEIKAVGLPGDSTILNLENVQLSDEDFNVYPPDVVIDGSVSIYTEIISISVDPSDIDFGKIYEGGSGTSSVTITNDGNVEVSVIATLGSEVPEGFYTSNFNLDDLAVSDWFISLLSPGASELVDLSLEIPVDTEPGFKTAILTFWAETP